MLKNNVMLDRFPEILPSSIVHCTIVNRVIFLFPLLQVLLLVDASFGFEMETFEFLNILQTHGFPKVMGVLTHLDMFHSTKTLRKTKKKLKQRFWTEIYQVL